MTHKLQTTINAGIYVPGLLYASSSEHRDKLKNSGFTTAILWALHVSPSGTLYNGGSKNVDLIKGGQYVADPNWPQHLADIMTPAGVNKILISIGGWGATDFEHMKNLIFPSPGDYPNNPQIGSDTILYKNFKALKDNVPSIVGVDFDDESLYDKPTTVAFSQLLNTIGFEVTFCPYTSKSYWIDCLKAVDTSASGAVTGFNLQCYSGGSGNSPSDWISAIKKAMGDDFNIEGFLTPGLSSVHNEQGGGYGGDCPETVKSTFAGWKSKDLVSGFIWDSYQIEHFTGNANCEKPITLAAYASALKEGLL